MSRTKRRRESERQGAYRMVCEDGDGFEVAIPAFSLDSPQARRVLN